ncbi:hypothetical protein Bca52824_086707 [Brassica carinata]|uniref:DUF1985 domain-containing protein n=1 Tax=Brassica carinata TaxID=52824 RepID=A0A8X7TMH2_BRACI|nr:hypothetical protein Bca52824_086707 [Brassica carinata]
MSRRRSLRGKEIADVGVEDVKGRLPERLYATDRYPSERINMYSTIDNLLCVRDALDGTEEMALLLTSCFGSLFRLLVRRLLMGKVIHGMLTRQVVTKKKYEIWPVFGGNLLRFSLVEFGEVTGLPCSEFEEGYSIDYEMQPTEDNYAYWERLIGPDQDVTIEELVTMVLGDTVMPRSRKLRLCLIIIVDGVLVPTSQKARPSLKHVNLVKNLKNFAFQWGRESFLWAIRTMMPGPKEMGKCEDPNGDFCKKLRQKTIRILGFPLELQLVAFELIPQLLKEAGGDDSITLLTFPGQLLPQHAGLNVADLRKAEYDLGPMMEISETHDDWWGAWDEEKYDQKGDNLLGLIKEGHVFSKSDWGGGDAGEPIYVYREKTVGKKRKRKADCGVTKAPVLKQRRLSACMQELGSEVMRLKDVVEKQARKFEKWKTFVKGKSAIKKQGSVKRRGKRRTLEGREGIEFHCEEDVLRDDGVDCKIDRKGDDGPKNSARTSSEESPMLLVRLPAGDGVSLQWVEPGTGDKVVYHALNSQTFFVSEDEGSSVGGGSRDEGGSGDGLDAPAMTALDALGVAALCDSGVGSQLEGRGAAEELGENKNAGSLGTPAENANESENVVDVEGGGADGLVVQSRLSIENENKEGETVGPDGMGQQINGSDESESEEDNADVALGQGEQTRVVIETEIKEAKTGGPDEMGEQLSVENENEGDKAGGSQEAGGQLSVQEGKSGGTDGLGEQGSDVNESESKVSESKGADVKVGKPKTSVLDVSDSSCGGGTVRHEPLEHEGELAAVLLDKDQYITPAIVPTDEDCDYAYFERVLLANLKVEAMKDAY